jgi:hypothetical protein
MRPDSDLLSRFDVLPVSPNRHSLVTSLAPLRATARDLPSLAQLARVPLTRLARSSITRTDLFEVPSQRGKSSISLDFEHTSIPLLLTDR